MTEANCQTAEATTGTCRADGIGADDMVNILWTQPRHPKGTWTESTCASGSVKAASTNGLDTRPTWLLWTATFSVSGSIDTAAAPVQEPVGTREDGGGGDGQRPTQRLESVFGAVGDSENFDEALEKACHTRPFALCTPRRPKRYHMANLFGVLMGKPPAQQAPEAPADEDDRLAVTLVQLYQPVGKAVEYVVGEAFVAAEAPAMDMKTMRAQVIS